MKTYKVDLCGGTLDLLRLSIQKQDDGAPYWDFVALREPRKLARFILLSITNSTTLTFANEERFERHFLDGRTRFPRFITESEVFDWLGGQTAARL